MDLSIQSYGGFLYSEVRSSFRRLSARHPGVSSFESPSGMEGLPLFGLDIVPAEADRFLGLFAGQLGTEPAGVETAPAFAAGTLESDAAFPELPRTATWVTVVPIVNVEMYARPEHERRYRNPRGADLNRGLDLPHPPGEVEAVRRIKGVEQWGVPSTGIETRGRWGEQ